MIPERKRKLLSDNRQINIPRLRTKYCMEKQSLCSKIYLLTSIRKQLKTSIAIGSSSNVLTACILNEGFDGKELRYTEKQIKEGFMYSRKVGQAINELIETNKQAVLANKFKATKKLAYFPNLFRDYPRRAYWGCMQSTCTTFEEACIKIHTDYSSIIRQRRVRIKVQNLLQVSSLKKNREEFQKPLNHYLT